MPIYSNLSQLIGHTPLVEVPNISRIYSLKARLLVKLEYFNPGGSAKDRIALQMVKDAESQGKLLPGGTIIEPTSGNTGVGLALIAAIRQYTLILTMPETMSMERRKLLAQLGAKIVLTPGNAGMQGAVEKAQALQAEISGSIILDQFANPSNPLAHYITTGQEIWEDCDGQVDCFVAGIGTGGTFSGSVRRLKEYNSQLKAIAVEPDTSALLSGKPAGPHKLQGIGANFVPANYDATLTDKIMPVSADHAFQAARMLAKEEGMLVGITSGAAFHAAFVLAQQPEWAGKTIVVLLPDTGERYLSTELFQE